VVGQLLECVTRVRGVGHGDMWRHVETCGDMWRHVETCV
jgi:hypothetical protein